MTFVSFAAGQARRAAFHYAYNGPVTEGVIAVTSQSLRAELATQSVDLRLARRVFSSYVELAYNVLHHGAPEAQHDGTLRRRGEFVVEESAGEFVMTAVSRVTREAATALLARIDQFKDMTPEQIRFEYQLRLSNLRYEPAGVNRGGAGLGLVTVARDCRGPLTAWIVESEVAPVDTCLFGIRSLF